MAAGDSSQPERLLREPAIALPSTRLLCGVQKVRGHLAVGAFESGARAAVAGTGMHAPHQPMHAQAASQQCHREAMQFHDPAFVSFPCSADTSRVVKPFIEVVDQETGEVGFMGI